MSREKRPPSDPETNQSDPQTTTPHAMTSFADPSSSLRLLAALGDETDPVLVQVVDRVRRGDGLVPSQAALEGGPLSEPGDPVDLFCLGLAEREDYLLALAACEAMSATGNAAERELAATSIAVLEASSIVYRGRLLVSRDDRQADARLAHALAALRGGWARLVASAMRARAARRSA
jgi:hypothetical protein